MLLKLVAANLAVFGLALLTNLKPEQMYSVIAFNAIAYSLIRVSDIMSTMKIYTVKDEGEDDAGNPE